MSILRFWRVHRNTNYLRRVFVVHEPVHRVCCLDMHKQRRVGGIYQRELFAVEVRPAPKLGLQSIRPCMEFVALRQALRLCARHGHYAILRFEQRPAELRAGAILRAQQWNGWLQRCGCRLIDVFIDDRRLEQHRVAVGAQDGNLTQR